MESQNLPPLAAKFVRNAKKRTRVSAVEDFYATYARDWPRLSTTDVDKLVKKLKVAGNLLDTEWAALPLSRTRTGGETTWYNIEDEHFRGLEDVFKSVIRAAEEEFSTRFSRASRTTNFMCLPRRSMQLETNGTSPRVDAVSVRVKPSCPQGALSGSARNGSFKLRRSRRTVFAADTLITAEFRGPWDWSRRDRHENDEKIFCHAAHALFNDVARVAAFSFTIEGTWMRVWCHTRTHTGLSKYFNINKNPGELIQFILFSTYATPTQLGIDPSVHRVVDEDGLLQYQFDVCNPKTLVTTTYQTVNLIAEPSVADIYSRTMRVFEVREVTHPAELANVRRLAANSNVLRDFWVYEDAEEESCKQSVIIQGLKEAKVWASAAKHFMNIIQDGIVLGPSSTAISFVPPTVFHGITPTPHADAQSYKIIDASRVDLFGSSERKATAAAPPPPVPANPLPLQAKVHVRTVYKQVCRDLFEVTDPAFFFYAMSEVAQILRYLKLAGYVHRDVSPGNFLLHYLKGPLPSVGDMSKTKREDWVTIVSDLEYSQPFLTGEGHDSIVGTSYYIAVEVQTSGYWFKPEVESFRVPRSLALKSFAFNPYHDLESSLWMALDFVVRRAPQKVIDTNVSGRPVKEILQQHAQKMFVARADGSQSRWKYLTSFRPIRELRADLRLIYGEAHPIPKLADCIVDMRQAYIALQDSVETPTVPMANGRHAFDPALFKDVVYDKLEAVYTAISDHYACANNADTFVWVPKPPGPVYYTFSGETDPGSDVDGSSDEDLGEETDEEGLPKDDRAEALVGKSGEVGDDMHVVNNGSVARDASEAGAGVDGIAAGPNRAAPPLKRKRDDDIQPEPPMQKAKRSRTKGAAPTRRSDRIRKMLAKKDRPEEAQVPSASRSKLTRSTQRKKTRTGIAMH
ncbi:hypothetical protein K525DRAFT_244570 [Schizophyllum commune Loenen D]|nr:hypothetical protein K525DRAFT_244570 [Schizophyllum commune Loenen D]